MRRLGFALRFLLLFALFGPGLALSEETASMKDYLIHPSDVLEISVYGEPELTRELVVRPDGKISFPLIGDIGVAGHGSNSEAAASRRCGRHRSPCRAALSTTHRSATSLAVTPTPTG